MMVKVVIDVLREEQIPVYRMEPGTEIRTFSKEKGKWEPAEHLINDRDVIAKSEENKWSTEKEVSETIFCALYMASTGEMGRKYAEGSFYVHFCFSRKTFGIITATPFPVFLSRSTIRGSLPKIAKMAYREALSIDVMEG